MSSVSQLSKEILSLRQQLVASQTNNQETIRMLQAQITALRTTVQSLQRTNAALVGRVAYLQNQLNSQWSPSPWAAFSASGNKKH